MALTFPLTAAQFFDKVPVDELVLDLGEALSAAPRTAGGEITTAELGARLWQGRVKLGKLLYAEIAEVRALMTLLRGGGSFLAWDTRYPGPRLDPAGTILGGATVTLTAVATNRRDVTLGGLPAAYVLSPGDRLGFSYGSSPVRRALHEVVQGGTASGGGSLTIEVAGVVREGFTIGTAVTLVKPLIVAKVLPGTWEPGTSRRGVTEGAGFAFTQTLGGA